jgi:hypothetical protein
VHELQLIMAGLLAQPVQVVLRARTRQIVEDDDGVAALKPALREVAADEAGSASDKYTHSCDYRTGVACDQVPLSAITPCFSLLPPGYTPKLSAPSR